MKGKLRRREMITLIIFTVIALLAGLIGYVVDQILTEQPEGQSLGMGLWLVLPFFTGLILRIINKDMREMGFAVRIKKGWRGYIVAFLSFPVITLICGLIAYRLGGLTIGNVGICNVIGMIFATFFASFIQSIFEEFAWRGCLVSYLEKIEMKDWGIYLYSGFVWGIWHITYYLYFLPDEYFVDSSREEMVISGMILMMLWSPLFAEVRRVSKSVWPCVLLHAMQGAVPTLLFVSSGAFSIKEKYSFVLHPVSGLLATVLVLAFGLMLRKWRINQENSKKCLTEVER